MDWKATTYRLSTTEGKSSSCYKAHKLYLMKVHMRMQGLTADKLMCSTSLETIVYYLQTIRAVPDVNVKMWCWMLLASDWSVSVALSSPTQRRKNWSHNPIQKLSYNIYQDMISLRVQQHWRPCVQKDVHFLDGLDGQCVLCAHTL